MAVIGRLLRMTPRKAKQAAYSWLTRELVRKKLDAPNGRVCPRAVKKKRTKFQTRPRGSPCSSYRGLTLKPKRR
jgi:hypothetical protein